MTHDLLSQVLSPSDVKLLDPTQLDALCAQIRETLVEYGKRYGGHIGSNLGLVEACVALHVVFESPLDKIVFDVSHQSYVHKMLTGRAAAFRRCHERRGTRARPLRARAHRHVDLAGMRHGEGT